MKTELLSVLANGKPMGELSYENNSLTFRYFPSWQTSSLAYPLSVSMPLAKDEHGHEVCEAFLWGLLPDNDEILKQYGRQFHVSPRNVFRLLQHLGKDCAGAIQFVDPSEKDHFINNTHADQSKLIDWLSESDLDKLIRTIKENNTIQRSDADQGHFSLAGAQPKTALFLCPNSQRWGVPKGVAPTTHILKPAMGDLIGVAENEHYCLQLASNLGLDVAKSSVIECDGIPVIVLERYDRIEQNGNFYRIHQEDFCQAKAVLPHLKYQSDGGPAIQDIANTIWEYSHSAYEDICTFADTLIINYLIIGTDAHAKNYSLLHYPSGSQLAPLYDVVSAIPYPNISNVHKAKMAMKIGSAYHFKKIEIRHWHECAKQLKIKANHILQRIEAISHSLPKACQATADDLHTQGLTHTVIDLLTEKIASRAEEALEKFCV